MRASLQRGTFITDVSPFQAKPVSWRMTQTRSIITIQNDLISLASPSECGYRARVQTTNFMSLRTASGGSLPLLTAGVFHCKTCSAKAPQTTGTDWLLLVDLKSGRRTQIAGPGRMADPVG